MTERYVLDLRDVDQTDIAVVGGKGAHLGALTQIDGVPVPEGFCVTTDAYRQVLAGVPAIDDRLDQLSRTDPDDRDTVNALAAQLRHAIEETALPRDVGHEVTAALAGLAGPAGEPGGGQVGWAVRSSATAEDLPTASFAGQQDSYLNIIGAEAVLRHISRCWASLFTNRAVTYRRRNGIDDRDVAMAVVVQRMVVPAVSGVLFTADPVTGDRTLATVESVVGLGEALVSGRVSPDVVTVRAGTVITRTIATKHGAVLPAAGGGTREMEIDPRRWEQPALTDEQAVRLVALGRRIEIHFGRPQDIEWCLTEDGFHIVQSRPITTLFPVPEREDGDNHVYVSVGHQQMMTDPMRPLGWSLWQLTAMTPMHEAGGRLFVDVTGRLAAPAGRAALLDVMGRGDPLVADALRALLDRDDGFIPTLPDTAAPTTPAGGAPAPIPTDPTIVTELVERSERSVKDLERDVRSRSGQVLFDFLLRAFEEHKQALSDLSSIRVIMAGMEAHWWLNDNLHEWLGDNNAADPLTLSAPGNITSEMGLALLDVADVIRPHPRVVAFLETVDGRDNFLDELARIPGGEAAREAIESYLDRFGMRCVGEIDVTRPRWREQPATLVPALLDNLRNFEPGAAARRFEHGRRIAREKEDDVLARLRALPDGDRKADQTKQMIDRVRTFIGYREYPKYWIISRYWAYRQALLREADRLTRAGVLGQRDDAFYLTFHELRDTARTGRADHELIRRRRDEFRAHHALTPPRVLTSDGETLNGAHRRDDVPAGALIGLPVSAGTVEGRARVILDIAQADLQPGDILVTTFTDPSWSPLFVGIAGLVTEVGGQMTHGAVIAREYGLPAVVGVDQATRLIRDGQRIRVHGSDGYVELLPDRP